MSNIEWREIFSVFVNGLWTEAVNTSTMQEDNLITMNRHLSPFQQCFRKEN